MNHLPGTILHFNRFQFEGPATATRPAEKNKFFIVLRYPKGDLTAYVFEALAPVATNGWFFSLRTYMYGYQVSEYSYDNLSEKHSTSGREITVKGRLISKE